MEKEMSATTPRSAPTEKIILGVDPGTQIMGYGLIAIQKKDLKLIQFGVINLSKYSNHEIKLKKIFERITQLIEDYLPDEMALEAPFYGKNVQSCSSSNKNPNNCSTPPTHWPWRSATSTSTTPPSTAARAGPPS